VNPAKSPYPHWDARGDAEPLYDNCCQYLIVLSAIAAGQQLPYTLERLAAGSAKGVRLVGEGEEFVVLFNHARELVTVGDLETDAEKVVLRLRGETVEHEAVGGSVLTWRGVSLPLKSNQ